MKKKLIQLMCLSILALVFALVPVSIDAFDIDYKLSSAERIEFSNANYEVKLYPSYNENTKKVQTNLQIKDRKTNVVRIFKKNEFSVKKDISDNGNLIYTLEIAGFGKFTNTNLKDSDFISYYSSPVKEEKRQLIVNNTNTTSPLNTPVTSTSNDVATNTTSNVEDDNNSPVERIELPRTVSRPNILVIGDSNSENQFYDSNGNRLPDSLQPNHIKNRDTGEDDKSWVEVLDTRFNELSLAHNFINISKGGTRVTNYDPSTDLNPNAQSLFFLDQNAINQITSSLPIDILVLNIGTNDAVELREVNEFISSYRDFIVSLRVNYDIKNIILVTPTVVQPVQIGPNSYFIHPDAVNLISAYRENLLQLPHSLTVTRQYPAMNIRLVDSIHINNTHLQADNIHLSKNGEYGMADLVQPVLMDEVINFINSK